MSKELLVIYRNYLFALQTIEEYGNKFGDEDVIKIYEEKLIKANILKKVGKQNEKNGKLDY